MIRVLLADDQAPVRAGFRMFLNGAVESHLERLRLLRVAKRRPRSR